uniref:Uncharacterized protein n=1 Tax=Avena sativa TaxID=4498 RepID=A0ACD5XNF3_AVESA
MLAVHYYMIFDGSDAQWCHMKSFYKPNSIFSFSGETHVGKIDIFDTLSRIRQMLKDGFRAEGMPSIDELSPDILSNQAGHFQEDFFFEPGTAMGCYVISKQELHISET